MYKKLLNQIGIYGVGTFLTNAISFLLVPVYISSFTPAEFGILAMARIAPVFLMPLITLNLNGAVLRLYLEWVKKGIEKKAIFTLWIFSIIWSFVIVLLILSLGSIIFPSILKTVAFDPFIKIAIITEAITVTALLSSKLLRIKENAKLYSVLSFLQTLITLGLVIYFVTIKKLGILGALYGFLFANGIMMVFHSVILFNNSSFKILISPLYMSLRYTLPLVPGNIIASSYSVLDRFLLDKFVPINQIGLYSFARRFAQLISMIISVFQLGMAPFFIRVFNEKNDYKKIIGNSYSLFCIVISILTIVLSLFIPDVIIFLGEQNYYQASGFVGALAFIFMLQGLGFFGSTQVSLAKKTIYESYVSFLQFILFGIIGYILISEWEIQGLLITYIIVNSIASFTLIYFGQKLLSVLLPTTIIIRSIMLVSIIVFLSYNSFFFLNNHLFITKIILFCICTFLFYLMIKSEKKRTTLII